MGQAVMRRPPKYVQGFVDRHRKPRFYFRRPGFKVVPLPGLPWSPEFMAVYEEALAGHPVQIGSRRVKPGTIRALAVSYYDSHAFRMMSSQSVRRNIIERFCRETDKEGRALGDKSATTLQRAHIVKLMEARSDRPDSANGLRKALRAMMQHAVVIGWRTDNPTRDVKPLAPKSKTGFHSWEESEIEQFESRHSIGSRARLAFTLLLYTGQRRSDVVRMGRQHIRDGVIQVRQVKTGTELFIPIHPVLQDVIAQSTSGQLTLLVTEFGNPFKPAGFGNWFREQCDMANLRHCSAHGLRKAAARRLAEAGCSTFEVAAITGHASLRELEKYTKAAAQKKLAVSAMARVKTGTSSVKPDARVDKKRRKS